VSDTAAEAAVEETAPPTHREAMLEKIAALHAEQAKAIAGGGETSVARHHARGKLLPRERIELLIDEGTAFLELAPLAAWGSDFPVGASVVTGIGVVEGVEVMISANDPSVKGGASNPWTVKKIFRAAQIAQENGLPTVSLVESGGADLPTQKEIFIPGGKLFRDLTRASARKEPTVALVFGNSTAGGAYVPGMSDYTVMVKEQAKVFLGGPPLVKMATGEESDDESLGGAEMHARVSGLADYLAEDERDAIRIGRRIIARLNRERPRGFETGLRPSSTTRASAVEEVALQPSRDPGRAPQGHAIEVRLYAEDAADDWSPQTGLLRTFEVPDGVRSDSAVESGSVVSHFYDPMIAKVVAYGADRRTAIRKLDDALRRTRLHGLVTNRDLLRAVLVDDAVVAGEVHTGLLPERIDTWTAPALTDDQVERLVLAGALAQARLASTTARGQGRIPTAFRSVTSQPRVRRFLVGDDEVAVSYTGSIRGLASDIAEVVSAEPDRVVLAVDGVSETYDVTTGPDWVDVDGPHGSLDLVPVPTFVDPADVVAEGSLLAPMPASVTSVAVEAGQKVAKGDTIVVLEAMKMQHTIAAPADGVVTELAATAGQQVESGAVLAVIETEEQS